jgi:hypothetical protein
MSRNENPSDDFIILKEGIHPGVDRLLCMGSPRSEMRLKNRARLDRQDG